MFSVIILICNIECITVAPQFMFKSEEQCISLSTIELDKMGFAYVLKCVNWGTAL